MICDNNLLVSGAISATGSVSGQFLNGNSGSVLSTNTIDLLRARDIGEGVDLYLRSQMLSTANSATSVEIQAVVADDAGLSVNVNVVGSTGAIPIAKLVSGARFAADLNPTIGSKGQRYLGVRYVIVGTVYNFTAFTDFGIEVQDGQKFYPAGFTVA